MIVGSNLLGASVAIPSNILLTKLFIAQPNTEKKETLRAAYICMQHAIKNIIVTDESG